MMNDGQNDKPQHSGGITNYFQGATIHKMVINGNMYNGQNNQEKRTITDKQLADAISSICGEGKALDEYQNWLGICCYATARCDYPLDLKSCCERLKALPYSTSLYREVKYENIRMFSNWNFVKAGYDQWPNLKVNEQERTLFVKCRDAAIALDRALTDDNK